MNNRAVVYLIAILVAVISIPLIAIPMTSAENPKVIYHDNKGDVVLVKWYFTPKGGHPGDQITVRGYIYNGRSDPIRLYAESGIAKHGWQYFSIYGTPVKAQIEGGPCCPQNEFYDGGYFTIQPHQYVYVELHPHLPTQNSYDHCHNLGSVWNGINKDYDIAFIVVKPVNGDACWHSQTQHGQTLYFSKSLVYVGSGGFNIAGYYLDDVHATVFVLLIVGLIASATLLLIPKRR